MLKTKIGDQFGKLVVVSFPTGRPMAAGKANFLCACGNEKAIRLAHVIGGLTVSCGCVKRKLFVEAGQIFERIKVVDAEPVAVGKHLKVACVCSCGTEKLIGIAELLNGSTKSCGCMVIEKLVTMSLRHGGESSSLYSVWHTMKSRCSNPKAENFENYGGRGISICREWIDDFAAFRQWAESSGYTPALEIDRADVNGNYQPDNCRWVTSRVNGNNRRNNVLLTAFGETKTMSYWADDPRCAVTYSTLKQRISKARWSHEQAISEPSRKGFNGRSIQR